RHLLQRSSGPVVIGHLCRWAGLSLYGFRRHTPCRHDRTSSGTPTMRDLHLWRLLQSPTLDPTEAVPLLRGLAELPLQQRAAFLPRHAPAAAGPPPPRPPGRRPAAARRRRRPARPAAHRPRPERPRTPGPSRRRRGTARERQWPRLGTLGARDVPSGPGRPP